MSMKLTHKMIKTPYSHPITLCVNGKRLEVAQLVSISAGAVHKLWVRYQGEDYFFEESEIENLYEDI